MSESSSTPFEPEFSYYENFIYDPSALFWPVLHEVLHAKPFDLHVPGKLKRLATNMKRPHKASELAKLLDPENKASPHIPDMTPVISMIGGLVWNKVHRIPDTVSVAVYRDGNDFAGWHVDYEALLGPTPGDAWICIISLGAPRWLDFSPLPRLPDGEEPQPCKSVLMTSGSLMMMRGKTQRNFLHRVRAADKDQGPRISLTYLFDPPAERDGYPYMLMETGFIGGRQLPCPLFVGDAKSAIAYWEGLIEQGLASESPDGDAKRLMLMGPSMEPYATVGGARYELLEEPFESEEVPLPVGSNRLWIPESKIRDTLLLLSDDQLHDVTRLASSELAKRGHESPPGLDDEEDT